MISIALLSIMGIAAMLTPREQWAPVIRGLAIVTGLAGIIAVQMDGYFQVFGFRVTQLSNIWATVIIALLIIFLMVVPRSQAVHRLRNDHIALLLFSTVGALILARFNHFITLFLGMEMVSIPMYVLAAQTHSRRSIEASLKYFILGATATSIMTFGAALWYRSSLSFDIPGPVVTQPIGLIGIVLIICALAFKLGLAPFHFATPDLYEGSPTSFVGYMSSISKVAAAIAFFKVGTLFPSDSWMQIISIFAVSSLVVGSFGALRQQSVKRLMGYSSISQAGFWVILMFNSPISAYFGFAYGLASLLLFWVIDCVEEKTHSHTLTGLLEQDTLLGITAIISLISLTGLPPFAGFFGKYNSLTVVIDNGHWRLLAVVIAASIIGASYYFKIIFQIMSPPESSCKLHVPFLSKCGAVIGIIALVVVGILPIL